MIFNKSKPYVGVDASGYARVIRCNRKPVGGLPDYPTVHGAFKTWGGALAFADAHNAGEPISHAVAEKRAQETCAPAPDEDASDR